jgi:hypothetical protein
MRSKREIKRKEGAGCRPGLNGRERERAREGEGQSERAKEEIGLKSNR